ncbi:retrovirus-related pol polyprotein from transposon TNT 1-94 [Tanacetum coccineum]
MMGNLKLLSNFVEKFLGTVKFGKDQIAPILWYGDLVQGNGNDLLTDSRGIDLYSITLQDTSTPNPICLMAKATSSQAWLWHRRLSHLNFDTINLLSKNDIVIGLPKLKFIQEVNPDAADNSRPIFDVEPLQKVQNNDDNYNVFAIENEHPEQPKSVNDTYLEEQGDTNITIDSLDMCNNGETVD